MANPIFEMLGNRNPMNNIVQQIEEFKKNFQGDPKAEVEKLLNSGQMSQQQFNQFSQMASHIMNTFGIR